MRYRLWFSGNPIPKGRPRWGGRGFYTPEATRDWEEHVAWESRLQWKRKPLVDDIGIEFIFFREDKRPVDIDNLEKAMLDGMGGIIFGDDKQVKEKKATLRYSKDRPGVEVVVWTL